MQRMMFSWPSNPSSTNRGSRSPIRCGQAHRYRSKHAHSHTCLRVYLSTYLPVYVFTCVRVYLYTSSPLHQLQPQFLPDHMGNGPRGFGLTGAAAVFDHLLSLGRARDPAGE